MRKFKDVNELVNELKPDYPVYCIRPDSIKRSTKFFKENFPGKVLYAVKTNPNEKVIKQIISCGIQDFDVASLNEVKLIKRIKPNANLYFMHTIKSKESISSAYFNYNVRDFALDNKDELRKILEATNYAKDLNLYVRIAISNEHAEIDLSRKFGTSSSEALGLVRLCKENSKKLIQQLLKKEKIIIGFNKYNLKENEIKSYELNSSNSFQPLNLNNLI